VAQPSRRGRAVRGAARAAFLRFRERPEVVLGPGAAFVVPRGVEHCPLAEEETWVMLLEPAATLHTGEVHSPLTRSIEEQLR
jgi:mannose-6-phosphate isomerase-like protein (cupin superfamily)